MSAVVTEPYSTSCSPTLRDITTSISAIRAASASACCCSWASRAAAIVFPFSTCRRLPALTGRASLRGSRKLRA